MNHRRFFGTPEARFWAKVTKGEGCWEWQAHRNAKGYGVLGMASHRTRLAHRFSWEIHSGPVPDGLYVCHHCDNRACVRPDHLYVGTQRDNVRDCAARGRIGMWTKPDSYRGDANSRTKIPDGIVLEMRRLYATGQWTQAALAERFAVPGKQAQDLISGRKRTHLPMPSYRPRTRDERGCKIGDAAAAEIVRRYAGGESLPRLGAAFGVCQASVYKVIRAAAGTAFLRPSKAAAP